MSKGSADRKTGAQNPAGTLYRRLPAPGELSQQKSGCEDDKRYKGGRHNYKRTKEASTLPQKPSPQKVFASWTGT